MTLLLLLAACTAPDKDGDSGSAGTTPYTYEDTATSALTVTTEDAATAIDAVFDEAVSLNGNVLFLAYHEVMAYADETCPEVYAADEGGSMWNSNCTASSGASFTGFISVFEGMEGTEYNSNMRAEATVVAPDGTQLVVAGDIHTTVDDTAHRYKSTIDGVMYYDGPAGEGTWVLDSPDVRMEYTLQATADERLLGVTLNAAVGSLEGAVSAVTMSDVVLDSAVDFPCPIEPAGTFAVRDQGGAWADVLFDVDGDEINGYTIDEGECDGCGTMWYNGVSQGQVCVDPSKALAAALPPW